MMNGRYKEFTWYKILKTKNKCVVGVGKKTEKSIKLKKQKKINENKKKNRTHRLKSLKKKSVRFGFDF